MFKTTGIINETVLKEINKYVNYKRVRYYVVLIICFFCIGVTFLCTFSAFCGAILILTSAMFAATIFIEKKKIIKTFKKRMTESYGKPEVEYTSSFDEDSISCENLNNGGKTTIKYGSIAYFFESQNHIVLLTQQSQYIPVFKNCLSEQERAELIAFLKQKPTRIKWKKKIK